MTRQDNEVQASDFASVKTEDLASESFHAIAVDRAPDLFLGDRETQSPISMGASVCEYREVGVGRTPRIDKNLLEIRCAE